MGKLLNECKEVSLQRNRSCAIDRIKATLSKDEMADFLEALNDRSLSGKTISKVLSKRGISVSANTILNMRNRNDVL